MASAISFLRNQWFALDISMLIQVFTRFATMDHVVSMIMKLTRTRNLFYQNFRVTLSIISHNDARYRDLFIRSFNFIVDKQLLLVLTRHDCMGLSKLLTMKSQFFYYT